MLFVIFIYAFSAYKIKFHTLILAIIFFKKYLLFYSTYFFAVLSASYNLVYVVKFGSPIF